MSMSMPQSIYPRGRLRLYTAMSAIVTESDRPYSRNGQRVSTRPDALRICPDSHRQSACSEYTTDHTQVLGHTSTSSTHSPIMTSVVSFELGFMFATTSLAESTQNNY